MFHTFVYQPLYNILIFLYNSIPGHDFGVSIIVFTLILRLGLVPLYRKQIESQKKLQEIQPKIKEIQKKYKDDKERQTREIMEFYKKSKTNPFAGCLPTIIQLFFLIAIFRILSDISNSGFLTRSQELYSFVHNPGVINHYFLRIIDLTKPNVYLAVIAAAAQFYQSRMLISEKSFQKSNSPDKADFAQMMNKQMLYLGPALTFFIGIKFAAGLALYWLASTLFMIAQQWHLQNKGKKKADQGVHA